MLRDFAQPPIAGEYMHQTAFDVADRYGRDMFFAIERLGTDRLPALFAAKGRFDALFGNGLSDRVMQWASRFVPDPLPARMRAFRDRFAHHLILKVSRDQAEATRGLLARLFPGDENGDHFECTPVESAKAFLHRFVAAGAAVRYRAVHRREVEDIVALDVALPATPANGAKDCRRTSPTRPFTRSITGTSSARCSIRTTSCARAPIRWPSNTRSGRCWTRAGAVSGRTQRRPSLRRAARAGTVLPQHRSAQPAEPRHRPHRPRPRLDRNGNPRRTPAMTYFLGIDAGGSNCRARLIDAAGATIGEGRSGTANARIGIDALYDTLKDTADQAVAQAGLPRHSGRRSAPAWALPALRAPACAKRLVNWISASPRSPMPPTRRSPTLARMAAKTGRS
jgi:hypothetical protein